MEETKREKIKRQIAALLDKADSTTFDAERDAILAKVDALMMAHTIEQWELKKAGTISKEDERPIKLTMFVCGPDNPLKMQLIDLLSSIGRHTRCEIVFHGANSKYGDTKVSAFGFPSDCDHFEVLYQSLHMQLARQLEPRPDQHLSWIENLAMLKEAGQKWQRIHQLLQNAPGYPHTGQEWTRPIGVKFTKVYSEYCKDNQREQFKTSPITWQRNFADAYVAEISNRFYQIRKEQPYSGTMALAVRDRSQDVKNMLTQEFPKLGTLQRGPGGKFDGAAYRAGRQAGSQADISGGRNNMGRGVKGELA